MARQLYVARRSLERTVLLHQAWPSSVHNCRLFSSVSSINASNSDVSVLPGSPSIVHQSLVTSVPNLQALQRVRWLLQQPQRRVLLLMGNSASDSPVRAALERDSPAFELERRGHGIFGVHEFCQLLLRESSRERRIFGRAQLAALLLHNGLALPGASGLAATSTLQRRKGIQDLLQLFRLLEREGATPEQYAAVAVASGEQAPQELAETYSKYMELLIQNNATSWDGLVMDVLELCGVQKGNAAVQEATAKEFSQAVLKEYTDVVVDDVQRMTPAMATLVGHLCGQPSVKSSASFSRVLLDGDECPQTQILEQQILKTARCTGRERSITHLSWEMDGEVVDKRSRMQAFAKQVLTQSTGISKGTPSPVPLKCWHFGTSEAEERSVGAFLAHKLQTDGTTQATVLCPSHADTHRITLAFEKQGLPVQMTGDRFAAATNSTGVPIHLFDEPGVNVVYSLLCALCFPSDSRHLYNVLRSDYFAFPAELLSWLMEKEHRSHVDLFPVLEAFVKSQGKSLGTSLNYRGGEELELPQPASSQLESGLEIAESFVNIIKRLRAESHQLSAAEIVQSFLEDIGRLDALLSPSSPEQERESLVLADFLRELETAQNVVKSDHVTFVAPYLQQLRETNLTSSVSLEDAPEVLSTNSTARDTGIQVLPLTTYALESLASSVSDGEYDRLHVLVLMSMRDSKFPGRMKRLTLPLPYELLSEPYPVQTRTEHLEQCEQLAYQALTLGDYSEVVLSFAELAPTSSSKRETLSRTFQPIWHEGDRPAATNGKGSSKGRTGTSAATSSPKLSSLKRSSTNGAVLNEEAAPVKVTSHFWLSGVAGLLREFVNRVFLPILHLKNRLAAADASPITTREDDNAAYSRQKQDAVNVKQPTAAIPTETETSTATSVDTRRSPASSASYKPTHLSYSQISEYLRCPHRYYLGRVMKLDGDVSTAMMFGRALHEGVAVFAKSLAATQLNGEVTQETKTLAAVEAKEAFMCAWVGDGYGLFTSKEQASFLLERGMMALWEFIETHYGDLQLEEIVHVEKEFSFHVPEANVELRGVWDRIDRVSSPIGDGSSSFVIKEFKSNLGGAERNMRKLADDSLQLKMYMYAFHKVFGEAPYGAKLQQIGGNYNEPSSDATKARRRRISRAGNDDNGFVHFSEEAAQEAKDAIVEVASGLRRGDFDPKPSFAECAFCPYAGSACHFPTDDASHERQSARRVGTAAQR
ncbi:hypothetical protein PC129_g2130 [Phytophthora cactorum]|uniref:Uncharacterized protein n=1 Tax=Phytophthora cactorum TaxID=29920 RepID=A0A329S8Z4_9STRA|nr:hypothetical protein Pcac1_g13559 [Phytophthora cactorum]KAG2840880.1 hypothetical protein PC112_g3595 [Phytophthora cactorum]KAG2842670.1 hypothetical protein PC111_g2642 [Phytophthora cactorum]KAG2924855.1 hypothetical protein PC114_g4341 [Phytophthora cactorum]KAG2938849.1 hypothetical protein PC115_g3522 [Phytophthora cactorum]